MSYLNPNRFTFSGTFQAAVSTINNRANNYGAQSTGDISASDQGWLPDGGAFWKIENSVVKSVFVDGVSSPKDPVAGMSFGTESDPTPAKLVDLDPQQQQVSEIWGMKLTLGTAGGTNSVTGRFKVAAFSDIWGRRQSIPGQGGSSFASATYQSVIEDLEWGDNLESPLLQALYANSRDSLSIKFTVDLHNNNKAPDQPFPFTFGRCVGAVGPYIAGEPEHFVSGRLLRGSTTLNFAPCEVVGDSIYVDLGNSTGTLSDGTVDPNQGELRLAILDRDAPDNNTGGGNAVAGKNGATADEGTAKVFDTPLDYTNYLEDASIFAVPLDGAADEVSGSPLGIVSVDGSGAPEEIHLRESSNGWYLRADSFVFRLNSGESETVKLRATQFGAPAPDGTVIALAGGELRGSSPPDALGIPSSASTTSDGWASFEITASDPGYPRKVSPGGRVWNLDGQVYAIDYSLASHPIPTALQDQSDFISVLISTDWSKIAQDFNTPTWDGDVQEVLNQYAVLYPVMRDKIGINLGDFGSVKEHIDVILKYMGFPPTDSRHMPVTRDLSNSKLALIKNWQANGCPQS